MERGVPTGRPGNRGSTLPRRARMLVPLVLLALPVAAGAQTGRPDIVNLADCDYFVVGGPPGGGGSSIPIRVTSNRVVTPVTAAACPGTAPVLQVAPSGTVAPGVLLTYTLTVTNDAPVDLQAIEVELPLLPEHQEPVAITDGVTATRPGGAGVPVSGGYDMLGRIVRWSLPRLVPGESVDLRVLVAVDPNTPADSLLVVSGRVDAAGCVAPIDSTQVRTPVIPPVLRVLKRADRSAAVAGDAVIYEIEVRHEGTAPDFTELRVEDTLPEGLRYVEGTARLEGGPVAEPIIGNDARSLHFEIGALLPGETRLLRLAAMVTALAPRGDAINRARARGLSAGGAPLWSPEATAVVKVVEGPFRREAYLVGRVFVDDDGDGAPGETEPGVPGVLVMLDDGRGAVTDVRGRWHLEGVRPGLRVMRLDPSTLPAPLEPHAAGAEWAGNAATRFVQARASTLVVADFPLGPAAAGRCTLDGGGLGLVLPRASLLRADGEPADAATAHLEAAARYIASQGARGTGLVRVACAPTGGDPERSETLEMLLRDRLERLTHEQRPATDLPAADLLDGVDLRDRPDALSAVVEGVDGQELDDRAEHGSPASLDPFRHVLRHAPARTAILSPKDAARVRGEAVDVDVIYPEGATPILQVNGEDVSGERIGVRSVLPSRRLAAARFVGVPLRAGKNEIRFLAVSPTGSPESVRVEVTRPGAPVGLTLEVPEGRWLADGVTAGSLRVEAVDRAGFRTTEQPVVTLFVENARPLDPDLDPDAEGHQLRLQDGQLVVRFEPVTVPGRVRVLAATERSEAELFVDVLPKAGVWTVLGLAEARVAGDGGVEGDGGMGPGVGEQIHDDGGRVSVFARGPVGKSSQLTVSVDSERKRDRDRLFRDYEPDLFYPVPGDSSTTLDQAPAQAEVFARIDGPRGFAQWGDFYTTLGRTELMRYDRRLNGASGRLNHGGVGFDAFAASTEQVSVRDVFGPDGSSGPFLLSSAPMVARSEAVYLETRDRHRTEVVLSRTPKRPDVDYNLDPIAGTLLFRAPVDPFDADLNPQRIVVLYESRSAASEQITAGGRLSLSPSNRFEGGLSTIYEERPGDDLELYGLDVSWRPGPGTRVRGEAATSDLDSSANAFALEVTSRPSPELVWDISWQDVDEDYANPSLLASPEIGSRRAGGSVLWEPGKLWRLRGEAFRQRDYVARIERFVAAVDTERRLGRVDVFGGLKTVDSESPAAGSVGSTLVNGGVRGRIGRRWMAEIGRDQVVDGDTAPGYPTRTTAGLSYALRPDTRLFLRHEVESGDGPLRDRTRLGIESRIGSHTRALAGYALEGGAGGAALRATTGVETVLPLNHRNAVRFSVARLDTMQGDPSADFTTLAGGYEYRAGFSVVSTRYEVRLGDVDDRHLLTASGAFKPFEPWTLFVRERLSLTDPDAGGVSHRAEGVLGAAYRPPDRGFRFLTRLDHSTGGGRPVGAGGVGPGSLAEPAASVSPSPAGPAAPGLGVGLGREVTVVERDAWSLSFACGARVTPRQRIAGSLVARNVQGDASIGLPSTLTDLLSFHHTTELYRRWTVGWSARRFAQEESGTATYGYGVELGYLLFRDLWIAGGYNLAGFEDDHFPGVGNTSEGAFFSVRFKFDEKSVTRLGDLRLDRP